MYKELLRFRNSIHPISMDSQSRASSLIVPLSWLLLLILSSSSSVSASSSGAVHSDSDGGKVSLELYYETLCPYCSNFIVNDLIMVFEYGLVSIVDLKLIPYGNAKIGSDNTITCQHGPAECLLNTVEACAIDIWPDLNEHFPFIHCVENLVYEHKYSEWESCFEKLGLDEKPVTDCLSSGYGKELEFRYAAETDALQPPHKYVPWVVVNGQPLYDDYENFLSYVCKAYNGTAVAEACSEQSFMNIQRDNAKSKDAVCYTHDTTLSKLSRQVRSAIASWINQMNTAASV